MVYWIHMESRRGYELYPTVEALFSAVLTHVKKYPSETIYAADDVGWAYGFSNGNWTKWGIDREIVEADTVNGPHFCSSSLVRMEAARCLAKGEMPPWVVSSKGAPAVAPASTQKLYEVEHSYYCNTSNFFSNDCRAEYRSWDHFMSDEGEGTDDDMNLVFRWDWEASEHTLTLFFMGQRKGLFRSVTVYNMTEEREPEVRAWLQKRWEHFVKLWAPISG